MKRLLLCALLWGACSLSAGVAEVQSVYLLPMPGGLDQYLANRLSGVMKVVTDPKLADAVFTNQLGEPFEQQLAKLYAPEPSPDEKQDDSKRPVRASSFSKSKGTVFLVDLKTRAVIWSSYKKNSNTTPDTLDRTASRIVNELKKAK